MAYQLKPITSEEFDRLPTEWNDLLARSTCDSVFLRWEWIHTWWSIFKQNKRLLILTVRCDGRLLGVAPFYVDHSGPIPLRVLKLCSDELSPDYLDVISERGHEIEVVREVFNYLFQSRGEWDVIDFDTLRAETSLLADPSLFRNYFYWIRVSHTCPCIKIGGSFEEYYEGRSNLRHLAFKKKLWILQNEKKVTHRVIHDEASLSKGLDDLFLLHEKRAVSKNVESNFLPEKVKRFHHELSRYFLKAQILNLQLLYEGEVPISALYAFKFKNRVLVYQTGFDPQWSKWSAGGVLWYLGIQKAFTEGLDEFDFLKGVESYKTFWSNAARNEMRLTVYNKNLRGSWIWALNSLKSTLRKVKTSPVALLRFNRNADRPSALGSRIQAA